MSSTAKTRVPLLFAVLFIALFAAQGIHFIFNNSQTYDEGAYLGAGYAHITRGDFSQMPEHPPLMKELVALPLRFCLGIRLPSGPDRAPPGHVWWLGHQLLYDSGIPPGNVLLAGRLPILVLGILLVAAIGWWAHRLWGPAGGLTALGLAALEPNLIAHSCLATTDLGLTLFAFLAALAAWEHQQTRDNRWLIAAGGAVGLGLASKFSAVLLFPVLGVCFLLGTSANGPAPNVRQRLSYTLSRLMAILFLSLLVLPPVYFFQGYESWIGGLRWQLDRSRAGQLAYFLGEVSQQGWLSYYVVALLLKTPPALLALTLLALCWPTRGRRLTFATATFLLTPVVVFLAAMSSSRVDLGVRYVLPVYPFLIVLAGRVATFDWRTPLFGPGLAAVALVWIAATILPLSPHHLAYFSDFIGGPARGIQYLGDSNLDWGQDLIGLKEHMDRKGIGKTYLLYFGTASPAAYGVAHEILPPRLPDPTSPQEPDPLTAPDYLAISVTHFQGIFLPDPAAFHWLRTLEPEARIGYSIHLYRIADNASARLQVARLLERAGERRRAVRELKAVLLLEPDHPEATQLLKKLQAKSGDTK